MKTTELMIGDLVYIYTFPNENPKQDDLMVAKLTCINSDEICNPPEPFCEGKIISSNGIFSRPIDTLIPIPLTPKILEKNGFEYFGGDMVCKGFALHNPDDNEYLLGVCGKCYSIGYVHQLQHALRLCGLEELADNLKIK